jgi:hypothetical protein
MKTKIKSCDTCSYYIVEEDLNLDSKNQMEFKKLDMSSLYDISFEDLNKFVFLLRDIRRPTCIGGLTGLNEIKKNCKYYANLPFVYNKSDLLKSFISFYRQRSLRCGIYMTIILGLLAMVLTIFGILNETKNSDLNGSVVKESLDIKNLESTERMQIKELTDSILKLNIQLKSQINASK